MMQADPWEIHQSQGRLTMKRSVGFLACLLMSAAAAPAWAQSALDRLERQVRAGELPVSEAEEASHLGATADDANELGFGVRLLALQPGGPAEKQGLKAGDLVTSVNGEAVATLDEFATQLGRAPVGEKSLFSVQRGEKTLSVAVLLGKRKAPAPAPGQDAVRPAPLGIRLAPVDEATRIAQGQPTLRGGVITFVAAGSAAERAGLTLDSVLYAVDGAKIDTPDDAVRNLSRAKVGQTVKLSLYQRGERVERPLTVEAAAGAQAPERRVPPPAAATPRPFSEGPIVGDDTHARMAEMERNLADLQKRLAVLEATLRKFDRDSGITPAAPDEKKPE